MNLKVTLQAPGGRNYNKAGAQGASGCGLIYEMAHKWRYDFRTQLLSKLTFSASPGFNLKEGGCEVQLFWRNEQERLA